MSLLLEIVVTMGFKKSHSKFVAIKGKGFNPTPWKESDSDNNLRSNGLLVCYKGAYVVVAPLLAWSFCSEIVVCNTDAKNETLTETVVVKAFEIDTLDLCVLASLGYDTIKYGEESKPVGYSVRKKKASDMGDRFFTASVYDNNLTVSKNECKYMARTATTVARDLYEPNSSVMLGDCVFKHSKFSGIVTEIASTYFTVVTRQHVDKVITDFFECESRSEYTGIAGFNLGYDLSGKQFKISEPQVLETDEGLKIVSGVLRYVNHVEVKVTKHEMAYLYDNRYHCLMPFDMWLQTNCSPGMYIPLEIDNKIINWKVTAIKHQKKTIQIDKFFPKVDDCYRIVGPFVIAMPTRELITAFRDSNIEIDAQTKGDGSQVPLIIDYLGDDKKKRFPQLQAGCDVECYQVDRVNDKYVGSLEEIDEIASPYKICYFDGSEFHTHRFA